MRDQFQVKKIQVQHYPNVMSTALNFKCDQVKLETERELNLSTDLLAEAGIEEPKSIFGKVPTRLLLTGYLIIYTVMTIFLNE